MARELYWHRTTQLQRGCEHTNELVKKIYFGCYYTHKTHMSNLAIGQAGGTAQRMLTTPASQTGAAYIAPAGPSVWGPPRPPRIVQPFIKEEIPLLKQTSGFDAGMRIRWDMTRDADFVHTLTLRVVLPAIPPARYQGGATYARYVDLPGLACWSQIVVRMGSIVLHTIRPEELLLQGSLP